jgi:hypothetical protein
MHKYYSPLGRCQDDTNLRDTECPIPTFETHSLTVYVSSGPWWHVSQSLPVHSQSHNLELAIREQHNPHDPLRLQC